MNKMLQMQAIVQIVQTALKVRVLEALKVAQTQELLIAETKLATQLEIATS